MKRLSSILMAVSLSVGSFGFLGLARAAEDTKGEKALAAYDDYYDAEKFDKLAGDDGLITEEDWTANRTNKEGRAFGDRRWDEAAKFDADGDGALDIEEAKAYKQAERRRLIKKRKGLDNLYENKEWLKENPAIARKLARNRTWRERHPKLYKEVGDYYRSKDVREHRKDVFDHRKDVRDHREDVRDRHEDIRDRRDDRKHPEDRRNIKHRPVRKHRDRGVRDHGRGRGRR